MLIQSEPLPDADRLAQRPLGTVQTGFWSQPHASTKRLQVRTKGAALSPLTAAGSPRQPFPAAAPPWYTIAADCVGDQELP